MFSNHYNLYQSCFPDYPLSYEDFCGITELGGGAVLTEETESGRLIGYAVTERRGIALLVVDEAFRCRGVGSRLLRRAEEILLEQGLTSVTLGRGNSMFQGVPIDCGDDAAAFFEKRGYVDGGVTYNMDIDTACYSYDALPIPKPEHVTYRFAEVSDMEELLAAVEMTDAGWVESYRTCEDDILLAVCGGEIAGFEMLSADGGIFLADHIRHGSIGCVGVIPKFRRRGIGLDMTARAVQMLASRGCERVQLLYLVLEQWYGRLGFYRTSTQWMGKKQL